MNLKRLTNGFGSLPQLCQQSCAFRVRVMVRVSTQFIEGGVKGDAAATTGFECPEAGCAFSDPTSAAVWAHTAEAHGIEHDTRRWWVGR